MGHTTCDNKLKQAGIGDWISELYSPNVVAMATRVGPHFTWFRWIGYPQNPLVGPNISGLSVIQAE